MGARIGLTMVLVLAATVACSDDSVSPTGGGNGGASSQGGSGGAGGEGPAPRLPCDALLEFASGTVGIDAKIAEFGLAPAGSGDQSLFFRTDEPTPHFGSSFLRRSGGASAAVINNAVAHDLVIGHGTFGPQAIGNSMPGAELHLFEPNGDNYPAVVYAGASSPRFVSSRVEDVFVGTVVDGSLRLLDFRIYSGFEPPGPPTDWGGGCASTEMRAAVLSHPYGYLIAQTSGSPWLTCNGAAGPATRLQVALGGYGSNDVPSLADELELAAPVRALHLFPRDIGYWLVVEGSDALTVYRTTDEGVFVETPFEIPLRPEGGPVALSGMGGRLAVGQILTDGQGGHTLSVRVFHPDGIAGIEYTQPINATSDQLALGDDSDQLSPDGLVAIWKQDPPDATTLVASHLSCLVGDF